MRGAEAEGWKDRRTGWWEFGRLKWRLLAVLQGRRRGRRSESEVMERRQSEPPAGDTGKSRPCSWKKHGGQCIQSWQGCEPGQE